MRIVVSLLRALSVRLSREREIVLSRENTFSLDCSVGSHVTRPPLNLPCAAVAVAPPPGTGGQLFIGGSRLCKSLQVSAFSNRIAVCTRERFNRAAKHLTAMFRVLHTPRVHFQSLEHWQIHPPPPQEENANVRGGYVQKFPCPS
jgi:hypothetical protein